METYVMLATNGNFFALLMNSTVFLEVDERVIDTIENVFLEYTCSLSHILAGSYIRL